MPSRAEVVWQLFLLGITPLLVAAMFELAKYIWTRIRRTQPSVDPQVSARTAVRCQSTSTGKRQE